MRSDKSKASQTSNVASRKQHPAKEFYLSKSRYIPGKQTNTGGVGTVKGTGKPPASYKKKAGSNTARGEGEAPRPAEADTLAAPPSTAPPPQPIPEEVEAALEEAEEQMNRTREKSGAARA